VCFMVHPFLVGMSDREPIVCNAALFAVGQFSEFLQVCNNLCCDLIMLILMIIKIH